MKPNHFRLLLASFLALTSTALASTTWYVDGVNGNDSNNCMSSTTACRTIRYAISLASSGDTIMVGPATYVGKLTISISLKVIGSGASTTIIDGGGTGSVVTISSTGVSVTLSKLTIRNGSTIGLANDFGAGILNLGSLLLEGSTVSGNKASGSAGIFNNGSLLLERSTVSGNWAGKFCSKKTCATGGGGIGNQGVLTILSSTIAGNSVNISGCESCGGYGFGGGVDNSGTMRIINSTITANDVIATQDFKTTYGGGIANGGEPLEISNSTISGNGTTQAFGSGTGGGIYGAATLQNSIVANNTQGGNCSGTMTSNGYNLSSDNTCNFNGPGDLNNTDLMLGPLQNNGGPTQTMAVPSGSPAIDAGNPNGCTDGNGHLLTAAGRVPTKRTRAVATWVLTKGRATSVAVFGQLLKNRDYAN